MKQILIATVTLMGSCALGWAQQPAKSGGDYLGHSWVGLLTSADCAGGKKITPKSAADKASDLTTSGRTTTPAVDASGTRGSATAGQSNTQPTTHDSLPRTGDINSTAKPAVEDPDWGTAKKQAAGLAAGCAVTPETHAFSLLLPDGRSVRFDDVANGAIAKQLKDRSNPGSKPELLRVRVAGKMQNGKIALDSIRM